MKIGTRIANSLTVIPAFSAKSMKVGQFLHSVLLTNLYIGCSTNPAPS